MNVVNGIFFWIGLDVAVSVTFAMQYWYLYHKMHMLGDLILSFNIMKLSVLYNLLGTPF